jgi:hypothetical protein
MTSEILERAGFQAEWQVEAQRVLFVLLDA